MFNLRKKDDGDRIVTPKCDEHESMVKKLARIEGDNFVIIALLSVILAVVLGKVI